MAITIEIPSVLRRFTNNASAIEVQARTVEEALHALIERHPALDKQLYAADRRRRRYVTIFVNSRDMRQIDEERTQLSDGDCVTLVACVAGG